jgi:hypothetical protein
MCKDFFRLIALIFTVNSVPAQTQSEVNPPFNIKTVSFVQNNQNVVPVFKLGDGFQFQFDDLYGTEANYYFEIVHCDYNWNPTDIPKTDYIKGFDGQRILGYENSINTLQIYSHYKLPIPNQFMQLRISGNYVLKILDESKEVVLSRKFIVYEDLVSIPMQIKRARVANYLESKHNIDFSIKSLSIIFQNPLKNVKVALFQNGQLNNAIKNIAPQYTIGNDLVYKYDSETQFWAGNEFLYFDNSNIRAAGNAIARIDSANGIYNSYLFTNSGRKNLQYTLFPDVNGNFAIRSLNSIQNEIEADYAWVYFSLSAPSALKNQSIYVTGMFNNYSLSPESKMDFNTEKNIFEKAILIKQGFTNFQYQVADEKGNIDGEHAVDGNFWQTENDYTVLVLSLIHI